MTDDIAQKELEILGGLKNAVARGENLEVAKMTFINAGYPPQVVSMAARRLMGQATNTVVEQRVPQGAIPSSTISVPQSNLRLFATRSPPVQPMRPMPMQQYTPSAQQRGPVQPFKGSSQPQTKKLFGVIPYWAVLLMVFLSVAIVIGASIIGVFWDSIFGP